MVDILLEEFKALNAMQDGIAVLDKNGAVVFWNDWLSAYTKHPMQTIVGKALHDEFPEVNGKELLRKISSALMLQSPSWYLGSGNSGFLAVPFRKLTGSVFKYTCQSIAIYPYDIERGLVIMLIRDETQLQEARRNATNAEGTRAENRRFITDNLTGLYNRAKMVQDVFASESPKLAIFSIDMFQELSKFYGYEAGDWLLKEVANRLTLFFDDDDYGVYKLPSAEYGVLSRGRLSASDWVDKVREFLAITGREKFHLKEREQNFPVSFTIGISSNKKQLMRQADLALKAAQEKKKAYLVYDDTMDELDIFEDNIRWLGIIREALEEDRIHTYYQPIINNETGDTEKYEVLVRLIDPTGRVISPYHFLQVAKRAKLYPEITHRVIEKAFEAFHDNDYEFSLNLSFEDVVNKETLAFIRKKLVDNPDVARRTVFEILESEGIENFDEVSAFIEEVKSLGGKIAIDDFGTGYSNFEYLIKLDVDLIKIDGSLIKNIDFDRNSLLVVETIVDFARKFGIRTVAEFVDSNNVQNAVKELGINYSQGFFLGKPSADIAPRDGLSSQLILNSSQKENYRDLVVGALASAVTVIAGITESFASVGDPVVDIMDLEKLLRYLEHKLPMEEGYILGVQNFFGGAEGEAVFYTDRPSARNLAGLLNGKSPDTVGESMLRGAIVEFLNIALTACARGFQQGLGLRIKPAAPTIASGFEGGFKKALRTVKSGSFLTLEAPVRFRNEKVTGTLLILLRLGPPIADALSKTITMARK